MLIKTTDGAVRTMIRRNQLLAFKQNGVWALPVAQFDPSTNLPITQLGELLDAFSSDVDHDGRVLFCLRNHEGTGKSPLALLAEGFPVEILKNAAATVFEHGAR